MLTGKELKVKRVILDIRANEIAKHLGIHKSYISKMENGIQRIPTYIYEEWAKYLKINYIKGE